MVDIPVRMGEKLQLNIEDLTLQGEGIGRHKGFTLFVDGALPGETVTAEVVSLKKKYGRARLLDITRKTPKRKKPECSLFGLCGGCSLQHLDYRQQLLWKRTTVANALRRIAKLDTEVLPVLGMKEPWRYRNKVRFQVGEVNGRKQLGFYATASHRLVPVQTCHLLPEEFTRLVKCFNEFLLTGAEISQVWFRKSFFHGDVMAVVFTGTNYPPPNLETLLQRHEKLVSIIVMDKENKELAAFGRRRLKERIGNFDFFLSPLSFFQVNPRQAGLLYETAGEYAKLTGKERVWDLYCGTGTIGLFMAKQCDFLVGVEINPAAVKDARMNARLNRITNAQFYQGKAEQLLDKLWQPGRQNVVILDPPRQGCDRKLLNSLTRLGAERVVYISCNPATLARDLQILSQKYQVKKVQPVDMFPHTTHCETVARIERVKG